MTRTTVIVRPFPQRGLLTCAEEHEKAVAAWHEENELAELETLLKSAEKLGVPIPEKALAAISPELRAWLGWTVALAIARQYHPDFRPRGQAGRRIVWDDTRLHELVADVWYDRETTKRHDNAIFVALADIDGPYSSRWGKLRPQNLQNRFIKGRSCPLIRRGRSPNAWGPRQALQPSRLTRRCVIATRPACWPSSTASKQKVWPGVLAFRISRRMR